MRELSFDEIHSISGTGSANFVTEKYLLTNYPIIKLYPGFLLGVGLVSETAFLSMCGFHLAGPVGATVGALILPTWLAYASLTEGKAS